MIISASWQPGIFGACFSASSHPFTFPFCNPIGVSGALNECPRHGEVTLYCFTTESQYGGWVPDDVSSVCYWHLAPRWRPLPWLANPDNPAMRPMQQGEEAGTCHIDRTGEKSEGGEGETLETWPEAQKYVPVLEIDSLTHWKMFFICCTLQTSMTHGIHFTECHQNKSTLFANS